MRPWKILLVGGGKIFKGNSGLVSKPYNIITIIICIKVYKVLTGEAEDLWMKNAINPLKIKKKTNKKCLYRLTHLNIHLYTFKSQRLINHLFPIPPHLK